MKLSRYTFLFDCAGKEFYVYNTLSNSLMEVDKTYYKILKQTQKDRNELNKDKFDSNLIDALEQRNFITQSDDDDFLKYKSIVMRQRQEKNSMHLTLAPTMDCCFRCHYCFEKYKEKTYMTPDIMDSIVKYVTSYPDLKNIKITWFGGEPLMAVSQIEEFYDKFSSVWTSPISSNIITTGYHINEEAIRVMKKVGITSAQITLDGLKETHNKVKHLTGDEDVFEKVLHNIELLNDLAPEMKFDIAH